MKDLIIENSFSENVVVFKSISKIRDHFLFTVESVSFFRPDELVVEALDVLCAKCDTLIAFLGN